MTVRELINKLQDMPQDKKVFIQQGELPEYMTAQSVEVRRIILTDDFDEPEHDAVTIEYE